MFLKKHHKDGTRATLYADKVSIIAAGMVINGDVASDSDIRIDGAVNGNVVCRSKVVISASGTVTGDINAQNVDVAGSVTGNITVQELLSLKAHCNINGDLTTEKLQIEPNATFNGNCTMQADRKATVNAKGVLVEN